MLGRLRCARPATGGPKQETLGDTPMRSIRILSLALLTSAAFAPAAFAQDSSSTDTASGKHFAVVGGISLLQPKNDPIDGIKKTDGGPAPTVSFSYYVNDNWAVELWGAADKFDNKFKGPNNVRVGRQRVPSVRGRGLLPVELQQRKAGRRQQLRHPPEGRQGRDRHRRRGHEHQFHLVRPC
ncbi:hypothetical protein G6F31_018330 [Rhizopus arrhizus]|nr:hypothetical protein G6F31_018330 [Rhizopus arrhizus]